ncbi:Holliday junction branch migration protein RuvA [Mycoplasma sp. 1573]
MIIYKYGKIVHTNKNYIILENNRVGELIYVPMVERFKKDENMKVFVHEYETEHFKTTYGFENFKELVVFEDLLSIQGIGPKTALSVLNIGWEKVVEYVASANINKLNSIPYLSNRSARQLIFEYQPKYEKFLQKKTPEDETENNEFEATKGENKTIISENAHNIEKSLRILGFRNSQIKEAMQEINVDQELDKAVEEAIKVISSKHANNAIVQN